MRRVPSFTVALALPALVVALPVLSRPVPRPHAVAPQVQDVAVTGIDPGAARSLRETGYAAPTVGPVRGRLAALSAQRSARPFSLLGVTWTEDRAVGEVDVRVRTRSGGRWSAWESVDSDDDHGPDLGTPDLVGYRAGTAPLWVGRADGVQVRVAAVTGAAPRDVRVSLIDPGTSDADAGLGVSRPLGGASSTAVASTARPTIITRAQWGADESIRSGQPEYAPTITMGFVHHTVSSNTYTSAQAPALVRSVYAFHVRSRGWSDIGYNFLVDKFGRIYEGRAGGVDRPVIGAHTGGLNTSTFGVSLLGTYTSVVPSSAQLGALQRILAWRLQAYHRNPLGTTLLTSAGGTRYAKGVTVRLNTVSGHRDGGLTACPGNATYARLPAIRSGVRALMGANLVEPVVTGASPLYLAGSRVSARAGGLGKMSWRWTFTSVATGKRVRMLEQRPLVTSVVGSWDLRDDAGVPVPPGRYRAVLEAWNWSGNRSVPFVSEVEVRSPLTSGLVVKGPDGTMRVLTGAYAERVFRSLGSVLFGPEGTLPVGTDQHAPFGPAPAHVADGAWFRTAGGVAYVVTGGVRRRVEPATATALKLPASPAALPDDVWFLMPTGTTLTDTSRHPDGMLVTDGTTTWRLDQGLRRRLTSTAAKVSWQKGRPVVAALPGDLALPEGAPLGPSEGALLRRSDGSGLVVSGGTLRPLASAAVATTLGYAVSTAPVATEHDLAALPPGEPVTVTTRHPSGTLVRGGTAYWQIDGDRRRAVHAALVAHDGRKALIAKPGDLALPLATLTAPEGFAARGADGMVSIVSGGRRHTLDPQQAEDLGYASAVLPVVEAAELGQLVPAPLTSTASHVSGSLVTGADGTWLIEGGARRPLTASVLATYRGRVLLPATPADLALPLSSPAPPAHGALVVSEDGSRHVIDGGRRRPVPPAVATRLGLDALGWLPVPVGELAGAPTTWPIA